MSLTEKANNKELSVGKEKANIFPICGIFLISCRSLSILFAALHCRLPPLSHSLWRSDVWAAVRLTTLQCSARRNINFTSNNSSNNNSLQLLPVLCHCSSMPAHSHRRLRHVASSAAAAATMPTLASRSFAWVVALVPHPSTLQLITCATGRVTPTMVAPLVATAILVSSPPPSLSPSLHHVSLSNAGSNYFPYRPELNFAYERDCKSYPDYSYDYNHRLPDYYDYQQYEAPAVPQLPLPLPLPLPTLPASQTTASGALQPLQTRTPPPRVPQMGVSAGGHRRTPSTVSNNSTVLLEHEELLYDYNNLNLNVNLNVVDYECDAPSTTSPAAAAATPAPPATLSKQELYAGSPKLINRMIHSPLAKSKYAPVARPASLPFEQHALSYQQQQQLQPHQQQQQTAQQQLVALPVGGNKFRSSLKKYNSSTLNGSISSQQGTPTNATPPDSLTSDDSSYLSAKEGSIGSQHSRVRFSPEAYLDASSNLPLLGRRMTSPATHAQQQQQRRHRHTSSASTPSPSASSSS